MRNEKGQFIKGSNEWIGRKHKKSSKKKMSEKHKGVIGYWHNKKRPTEEKSCNWKGNNVGYVGIHNWVEKWKGLPNICEKCGKSELTGCKIHWANIDHKYKRILDDYIRLCAKCHKEFDKINNKKI